MYFSIPREILYGEDNKVRVELEFARIIGMVLNALAIVTYMFDICCGIKPTVEKPCKDNSSKQSVAVVGKIIRQRPTLSITRAKSNSTYLKSCRLPRWTEICQQRCVFCYPSCLTSISKEHREED